MTTMKGFAMDQASKALRGLANHAGDMREMAATGWEPTSDGGARVFFLDGSAANFDAAEIIEAAKQ